MCRMAYMSNEALEIIPDEVLVDFFKRLEKACGGNGNGIGGFVVGGEAVIVKGVEFTCEEAVEEVRKHEWLNGVIFHTRLASRGVVRDSNCHPFHSGKFITSHNGTWGEADRYKLPLVLADILEADGVNEITDSEVIASIVGKSFGLAELINNGVILSLNGNGAMVHITNAFNWSAVKIDDVVIYASDVSYFKEYKGETRTVYKFTNGTKKLHAYGTGTDMTEDSGRYGWIHTGGQVCSYSSTGERATDTDWNAGHQGTFNVVKGGLKRHGDEDALAPDDNQIYHLKQIPDIVGIQTEGTSGRHKYYTKMAYTGWNKDVLEGKMWKRKIKLSKKQRKKTLKIPAEIKFGNHVYKFDFRTERWFISFRNYFGNEEEVLGEDELIQVVDEIPENFEIDGVKYFWKTSERKFYVASKPSQEYPKLANKIKFKGNWFKWNNFNHAWEAIR